MENYIIIGILVIVAVISICYTVKHFKGEGGCCGRGSYKQKAKNFQKSFIKRHSIAVIMRNKIAS